MSDLPPCARVLTGLAAWHVRRALAMLGLALSLPGVVLAGPVVERVRIPSLAVDGDGAPHVLDAIWVRPEGAVGRALPAVIALHGCGGVYSTASGRRDALSARHRQMAELLAEEGYAVLFPDSLRIRGRQEICTEAYKDRIVSQGERRKDALGALKWLQARTDVQPDRIALLGWSHGGSTVLATVNAAAAPVAGQGTGHADGPPLSAAIAFYPGCGDAVRATGGYRLAAPLLLLVGGADDWTSPRPCAALAERLRGTVPPVTLVVYPDTYHGFDGPGPASRRHLDVPNGVRPGQGVTVAVNPQAREDAHARVRAFLKASAP